MDTAPTTPPSEPSSLTDRLVGVITEPGEVFGELRNAPVRVSNWVVPLILATIASVIYFSLMYSQPAIMRGIQEQQEKAIHKQIAAGRMTQAQADQAAPLMAIVTKIIKTVTTFVSPSLGLFLTALVFWLALKLCVGARLPYPKILEVCSLALMIDVLQKLVRSFLILWKENILVTASPTLFLANPNLANKTDVFLSMFDVIDIWWLAVLGIGLGKVAAISTRTAGLITFGIWFGFRLVMLLLMPSQA